MPVSRAFERLLGIRKLQEEQERLVLESALKDQRDLEAARNAASQRERQGRALVGESARLDRLEDRQAGVVQATAARRLGWFLAPRIAKAQEKSMRKRQSFLEKRVERRQAETLIEKNAAAEAQDSDRRNQQALDDWYRSGRFGKGTTGE
jgi:hypothetical protein